MTIKSEATCSLRIPKQVKKSEATCLLSIPELAKKSEATCSLPIPIIFCKSAATSTFPIFKRCKLAEKREKFDVLLKKSKNKIVFSKRIKSVFLKIE